jgi:hypothetical protein
MTRVALAAYREGTASPWLCSTCASSLYGYACVWRSLHRLSTFPPLDALPLGSLLRDAPLTPCRSCGVLLWETLGSADPCPSAPASDDPSPGLP